MTFIESLCFLAIFSNTAVCRELALQRSLTTTIKITTPTTVTPSNGTNGTNPLATQRLESIKNSYSELNLLSKTKPSDFIFDFDKAVTAVFYTAGNFPGSLPATVIGASLGGLNITKVEDIRLQLIQNPSIGIAECRRRCGL